MMGSALGRITFISVKGVRRSLCLVIRGKEEDYRRLSLQNCWVASKFDESTF